jgi:uncharacterized protein (DUF4415 family)
MSANKNASAQVLGSDLAKADAHQTEMSEYDDLPELTDDMMVRAVVNKGGRPKSQSPKVLISLRYSRDVVDFFRATGDGWQSRMDGVLRDYVGRQSHK